MSTRGRRSTSVHFDLQCLIADAQITGINVRQKATIEREVWYAAAYSLLPNGSYLFMASRIKLKV